MCHPVRRIEKSRRKKGSKRYYACFRYAVKIQKRLDKGNSVLLRRESSEASRGGKRRNSHQSAVFGEAGNGTVVGISELVGEGGFEPPKS